LARVPFAAWARQVGPLPGWLQAKWYVRSTHFTAPTPLSGPRASPFAPGTLLPLARVAPGTLQPALPRHGGGSWPRSTAGGGQAARRAKWAASERRFAPSAPHPSSPAPTSRRAPACPSPSKPGAPRPRCPPRTLSEPAYPSRTQVLRVARAPAAEPAWPASRRASSPARRAAWVAPHAALCAARAHEAGRVHTPAARRAARPARGRARRVRGRRQRRRRNIGGTGVGVYSGYNRARTQRWRPAACVLSARARRPCVRWAARGQIVCAAAFTHRRVKCGWFVIGTIRPSLSTSLTLRHTRKRAAQRKTIHNLSALFARVDALEG